MSQINEILFKYFGYSQFRIGQEHIINNILSKRDVLAILPTGAGKSICYQIPALIFSGITIVISPLISLMKDQVDFLNSLNIPSSFLNSSMSKQDYSNTLQNLSANKYKILYISPERLSSEEFLGIILNLNISIIAIDEAHCVSQWGHDFRPSYKNIGNVILRFPNRPVIAAFTATATEDVKEDIVKILNLSNPYTITTGFDRKNLKFIINSNSNKIDFICNYLNKHILESGVIYCTTRKNVELVHLQLLSYGFKVSKYHGKMKEFDRTVNQKNFISNKTLIMVATNAFGMGINKPNIRYVIHFNIPADIESYYQEAGRAGRDGLPAECILLFSPKDILINKYLIKQINVKNRAEIALNKLNSMINYCTTKDCLRKYILQYFSENPSFQKCNNCSNCLNENINQKKEPTYIDSNKFTKKPFFDGLEYDSNTFTIIKYILKRIF